ncbi:MAG: hypothetical protein HXX16_10380 [Bacteroidales bacterium]|nr:hypothetical protein [Bacteroidales bacterium]
MLDLNTDIKRFYFKCSNCENKGEAVEVHYNGGVNDKGGFILKCNDCGTEFFLQMENPSLTFESRIVSYNFKVVRIVDFFFDEEKQLVKNDFNDKVARDILAINGQEEMPILKGAWKSKPEFRIDSTDEIFTCPNCKANIESESYKDMAKNIDSINSEYKGWFNYTVKRSCPEIIIYNSSTICNSCNTAFDYTAFAKFNGRGEIYASKEFYLADNTGFKPNVNGVYTREQSKRFLEKFVLRWSLIASKIIIVSPFIGFDKSLAIKTPYKFLNLLEWFLTLNSFDKTQVLIRKSEYGKIKEVIGKEIFETLDGYGLLNNIIEEMNSSTPRFHAKFYAGVIPNGENTYVEILTGSYNIHEESQSMENLIFIRMSLNEFEKQYLEPLRIVNVPVSYKSDFDVVKIKNNKGNLIFPKQCDEIL